MVMTIGWLRAGLAAGLAGAVLALAGGCLERKETIEVRANGSVRVSHRLKGDAAEFRRDRADTLPFGAPWVVLDHDLPRDDGKGADRLREASAEFASAAHIPETFGAPGDPAPLRARTALAIDRLAGGTFRYTFERRYAPRPYAWRERLFKRALPDDLVQQVARKDGEPIPEDVKLRAIAGLIEFERTKSEVLLEQAMDAVLGERAGPRARLAARASLGKSIAREWRPEALVAILDGSEEEQAKVDARWRADSARTAARAGAAALEAEGARVKGLEERLHEAFVTARRTLDATEDLQDETFEVRVRFPVPVVLADAAAIEDEGRTAVFRFGGQDLRDAEQVLRVVAEGRP